MTLEEAIKHAESIAESLGCDECGKEHKQLAEWLKELKEYKKKEEFKDNKYYTNSKDIVFCGTQETAKEIYDMYTKQGYKVAQSTVEIITGTHGNKVVKRLDILKY